MGRRPLNRLELRAAVEAAEARGVVPNPAKPPPRPDSGSTRQPPRNAPRLVMVWAVCDPAGRAVATYPYPDKQQAQAHAATLSAQRRGTYFVRAEKQPMAGSS